MELPNDGKTEPQLEIFHQQMKVIELLVKEVPWEPPSNPGCSLCC